MAPILVKYKITTAAVGLGTNTYFFLAHPLSYESLSAAECGVELASAAEQNARVYKVSELVRGNDVDRLLVSYKVGLRTRTARILCDAAKTNALLIGTFTYRGVPDARARKPQARDRYS